MGSTIRHPFAPPASPTGAQEVEEEILGKVKAGG
jgi:hypothetical protein